MTSRAVPVPGPMADRGTQAATADPGTQAATADPGTQAATADPGTQAATADPGTQAATADPGTQAATADQAATEGLGTGNFLGEAPHPRGALRSRGRRAGQGQRRESWAGRDQRS